MNARFALFSLVTLASACSTPALPPAQDAAPEAAARPDVVADAAEMDTGVVPSMDAAAPDVVAVRDAAPDAVADAAPDVVEEEDAGPETGRVLLFALDRLTIEPTGATTRAGFNLDGIFSVAGTPRSCSQADFASALDQDQNQASAAVDPMTGRSTGVSSPCAVGATCRGGVDNVLPAIADFVGTSAGQDVRVNSQRMIDSGELAFIVRISGVDDLMNDPSVTMRVYQAFPTFSTGCTSVLPDREYAIAQSSLVAGATSIEQARFSVRASIVGGRLIPRSGSTLPLPVAPGVAVDVLSTILRANVSETALTSGNLGGYARGSQFYNAVVMMNPTLAPLAAIAIGQFVDLEEPIPMPGGAAGFCARTSRTPPEFGNLGIGATFSAVRATIAMAPTATRPLGACGSM